MARGIFLIFVALLLTGGSATASPLTDPYKNFHYRLIMDGHPVAGFNTVSGLKQRTRNARHTMTLAKGMTRDTAFGKWASAALGGNGGLKPVVKKDLVVEVLNEAGQVAQHYEVHGCWVSAYQALPDLDANANSVAIEHMTLQYESLTLKP